MKKALLILAAVLTTQISLSQVGINTDNPTADLEIVSGTGMHNGVIIPKVTILPLSGTANFPTANQKGLLVYLESGVPATEGVYYFNGSSYVSQGALTVTAGGANTAVINSNAHTVTIAGGDGISVSEDTGTGTITVANELKPVSTIQMFTLYDDNGRAITNTTGQDILFTNAALEPLLYNATGNIEVRMVVRYRNFNAGTVNFMLRATTLSTDEYPINQNDNWIFIDTFNNSSTDKEVIATSGWKSFNAGIAARDIKMHAWIQQSSINIKNVYLVVRSQ